MSQDRGQHCVVLGAVIYMCHISSNWPTRSGHLSFGEKIVKQTLYLRVTCVRQKLTEAGDERARVGISQSS